MLYALGVYIEWNWLYDFDRFVLVVHQPRLDHVDEWEIRVEDLLVWARNVLVPAYQATLDPNAPFVPGETQCKFCKIRATCVARGRSVFTSIVDQFDTIEEAAAQVEVGIKPIHTLTNDQIAAALRAEPNATAWFKAVKAWAVGELARGGSVGDFKMVAGRANRKWGLPEADAAFALKSAGADAGDIYQYSLISPAAAEKLIGKQHPIWQVEGLVEKPTGKPTLAPGSDRRKALVLDPGAAFDVIEEE
jgi:hypothetical protein